jgi:hypothetical protein
MKNKEFKASKEYLDEEYKKGSLFLLEEYLDKLPRDWFDCVTFIATQGLNKNHDCYAVLVDEPESTRLFEILNKDKIKVYIFSHYENVIWNCALIKEFVPGDKDPKALFIGSEKFREFCDKRNIYYKSALSAKGDLISGSDFRYQKNEGEDCRSVKNE